MRAAALLVFPAWQLSGCALMQAPAPPPITVACEQPDQKVESLQQALAAKEAELVQLRAQQQTQAQALEQTSNKAARAEVKLRRSATRAGAASQLAETEVALAYQRGMDAGASATRSLLALHLLHAGAEAFDRGDYGAAVELAEQAHEVASMPMNGRGPATPRDVSLQSPLTLRVRVDSHLRDLPGTTAPVLGVVPRGAAVQAQRIRKDWLQVLTEDGRSGWMFASLLEPLPAQ